MSTTRRARVLAATVLLSLLFVAQAQAAHVTSLQPWKKANTYRGQADIDGRAAPQLEPRAFTNAVRKGQWVRISCQTTGQSAYGSTVWDKVGAYYVPDQLLKTYSDGFLSGAPRCGTPPPPPPAHHAPRCTNYTVYGLRGSGESFKGNHGMGATVGPTAETVRNKLRGTSVRLAGVGYQAASVDTLIRNPMAFQESMTNGEILLRALILHRIQRCPGTKIAVIGYSQGAGVASETLRHLPTSAFRHVRSAALIADTYSKGDSKYALNFDYFNPNRTTPVHRTGHGVFGARRLPRALHSKFDVCFQNDIVCDKHTSNGGTLAQAFVAQIHSEYKNWGPSFFPSLTGFVGTLVGNTINR